MKRILLSLCALFALTAFARAENLQVYISVGGDGTVELWDFDSNSGALKHRTDTNVGAGVGPLALSKDGKRMYTSVRGKDQFTFVTLARNDKGELEVLGSVPSPGSAAYLSTTNDNKYLLSAYYTESKIAVNPIDEKGLVVEKPSHVMGTGRWAHSVVLDPTNAFAFVPNTGDDQVYQFRFDAKRGRVALNKPYKVITKLDSGPRHFVIHPTLDTAYACNEHDSSVTCFKFDRTAGLLEIDQTLSTLPDDVDGAKNTCADIHLTPDGKYLYVSNRGHDSLAGFAVDQSTGRLTKIGNFKTEAIPREFDIAPDGKWVIAAGQKSGKVAVLKLDPKTGQLETTSTHEAGKAPGWVLIVKAE